MTRISVVIPAYNQGKYLEDCLESAYNQTVQAHEILVVDDGSTDDTYDIAKRFEFGEFPLISSPVRVIHQANKGLASARNTGIMNATGDYVLFLDSDDMLEENAIERLSQEIDATGADVVAPSFTTFGESSERVILGNFTMEDLKAANRLGYFCAVKRSTLLECGGYNPRMTWGYEDWDLWFDILKRGKVILVLQDTLVRYRTKSFSMITVADSHKEELLAQMRRNHPEIFR